MAYRLENLRILIVDDNSHIRQLLRTILNAVGIRNIDISDDGVAGFEAFCRLEYDIVFTDYQMEPISGIDLTDLIRTSKKSPNPYVPVIMISAYSDETRVQEARDHGVTEFLAKPFTVERLMERLEKVIEEPRPFVRTETYFGPDRRRKQDPNYTGPERRQSELESVDLTMRELSEQQRAALRASRETFEKIAGD
ncbi:MAG: response regulator [Alphaproteobacteria bacterium]|nr:response regulator [Alphaproteobacteria bacterium]